MSLAIMNVDPAVGPGLPASDQKRRFSRYATVRIPAVIRANGRPRMSLAIIRPPGSLMKLVGPSGRESCRLGRPSGGSGLRGG
jgi:hypothetical protein